MIDTGSKYSKRIVVEHERRKMRQNRAEKYHRQLAKEQLNKSKSQLVRQDENKHNASDDSEPEGEEKSGGEGGKLKAPRSWYLNINHVKVGDS